jgi:hypothetical protein
MIETISLPFDDGREILRNETLIIFFDGVDIDRLVGFGIKIVGVEITDGGKELFVARFHELGISVLAVPWIKRVEPDHSQAFLRKGALAFGDDVHVLRRICQSRVAEPNQVVAHLIVSPRYHDVLHSTSGFVNAVGRGVDGMGGVGVGRKGLWVNVLLGKLAADDKGVSDDIPLTFSADKEQELAEIVNEADELHPLHSTFGQ